jgi:hypothetical protein
MSHTLYPQIPQEALDLLNDPRTADLKYLGPGIPNDRRVLKPAEPPRPGESRFVIFSSVLETPGGRVEWLNKPKQAYALSDRGLAMLGEVTPRFRASGRTPKVLPDAWSYLGVLIASPRVADIMTRYEPAIQTVPIEWTFAAGGNLDGFVFLDIHRAIPAYDYKQSEVLIEHNETRKFVAGLGMARALRKDIDPAVHAFREAFMLHEVFVSRDIAAALLSADVQAGFIDPATMGDIRLTRRAPPAR